MSEETQIDMTSDKESKPSVSYWDKRVKIKIASDPNDPMGLNDVVVGVNGEVIRIKRDHNVMVKRKYVAALEDAVKLSYVTDSNGQLIGERKIPRYNMTVWE